jgi:predicted transcriptional regulator
MPINLFEITEEVWALFDTYPDKFLQELEESRKAIEALKSNNK